MKEIARGAEAVLFLKDGGILVKKRIEKGYRLQEIDSSLRKRRTRLEARLMREARRAGVRVPQILSEEENAIEMEYIDGKKVRDMLSRDNMEELGKKIGESIGKMHSAGLIHGDLTTSNMIFLNGNVFFIDFGLGFQSQRVEDKAVDIRLLRQALDSTHFETAEKVWKIILKAYQNNCSDASGVIRTLQQIEKRGRYTKR